MGVSGWMFLLVPPYPGCPRSKAVKRSLLLLLYIYKILLLLASTTTLVSRYQKVKPVWINWGKRWWGFVMAVASTGPYMQTVCTSLQTDNHTNTSSLIFSIQDTSAFIFPGYNTVATGVFQHIFRRQSCTAVWLTAHASIGQSSAATMATASSTTSSTSDTDTSVCWA